MTRRRFTGLGPLKTTFRLCGEKGCDVGDDVSVVYRASWGHSSRGNSYGNLQRNEEIAREKIRVEVAERRCDTQVFRGDPTVRFAPFQTGW